MKRKFMIVVSFVILLCALSACGEDKDFNGVWQKENSHLLLYVVGDGTVYLGDLGDVDGDELMYESKSLYTGEIDGGKLCVSNVKHPERKDVFEKDGDELVDNQGDRWRYVKESASIVRDE